MNFFNGLSTDGIKMEPGTSAVVKVKAEIMDTSGPVDVKIKVEDTSGPSDVRIKIEDNPGPSHVKTVKMKVKDTSGPSNVKINVEGTSEPAEVKAEDMKICVLDKQGWKSSASASSSDEDDFDSVPTQDCSKDWYEIENKTTRNNKLPSPEDNKEGKWLIFVDNYDVEEAWGRVRYALECGDLGHKAKVSTIQDSGNNQYEYVIGVYTYDWNDVDDVSRVRGALLSMDFRKVLHYKTEEDTNAGLYSGKRRNISKYSF